MVDGTGQEVFPTTVTIECVNAAKDLGVAYCYDRRPHACLRDRKLEGTHQRLDRLRDHTPRCRQGFHGAAWRVARNLLWV